MSSEGPARLSVAYFSHDQKLIKHSSTYVATYSIKCSIKLRVWSLLWGL